MSPLSSTVTHAVWSPTTTCTLPSSSLPSPSASSIPDTEGSPGMSSDDFLEHRDVAHGLVRVQILGLQPGAHRLGRPRGR